MKHNEFMAKMAAVYKQFRIDPDALAEAGAWLADTVPPDRLERFYKELIRAAKFFPTPAQMADIYEAIIWPEGPAPIMDPQTKQKIETALKLFRENKPLNYADWMLIQKFKGVITL